MKGSMRPESLSVSIIKKENRKFMDRDIRRGITTVSSPPVMDETERAVTEKHELNRSIGSN
jgi:hypothetical protein